MIDLETLPLLALDMEEPIAVLADLHANERAVLAVAEWLDRHHVSQALVLGDLVGYGASPQETVSLVRSRRWETIRGNHEDMLRDLSHVERTRSLKSSARRALDWTRSRLDPDTLAFLFDLPLAARVGEGSIAVHGSLVDPRHCYAYIYEFSREPNVRRLREIDPPAGSIVWFGHTHHPSAIRVGRLHASEIDVQQGAAGTLLPVEDWFFVNPGSVGFPRDGDPRAAFAVYEPRERRLRLVRVEYDVSSAADDIVAAGYDDGLARRLVRAR